MKKRLILFCVLASPAFGQDKIPEYDFVENWDLDQDGVVTVAERRGDVVYSFDENDGGFRGAVEYGPFDEARAHDMENMPANDLGAMGRVAEDMTFSPNDTDGDRLVSRKEFVSNAAAWITSVDRNGNGMVTTADSGQARG